jgi:hypothetical protein
MEDGDSETRRKVHVAIRKAARVARSRGVAVVPLREAREHLRAMFEDAQERAMVIATYDHLDDVIAFNPDHPVWRDMPGFMRDQKDFYSTNHHQHIVRHELGHAAHYRSMSVPERRRIWYAESLQPDQVVTARRVSGRATWSPKEFVAEVYAGLWGKVDYDDEVIYLFEHYRGTRP